LSYHIFLRPKSTGGSTWPERGSASSEYPSCSTFW